jgi:hypothetical protein
MQKLGDLIQLLEQRNNLKVLPVSLAQGCQCTFLKILINWHVVISLLLFPWSGKWNKLILLCKCYLNFQGSSRNHKTMLIFQQNVSPAFTITVPSLSLLCILPSLPMFCQHLMSVLWMTDSRVCSTLYPDTKAHWNTEMFLLLKGSVIMQQLASWGLSIQRSSSPPGYWLFLIYLFSHEGTDFHPWSPQLVVHCSYR